MSQEPERREEGRAPIELKVEYKRLNTFFYDYTKNISRGGTFIKTGKPLREGTVFLFNLVVPTLSESLILRGEVRWTFRPGHPPPPGHEDATEPGMGIGFIYDTDAQRVEVEQVVERLMVASLGQLIFSRLCAVRNG